MQERHTVGALRQPQPHMSHVERGGVVLRAQGDDAVHRHTGQQRGITGFPEVSTHQVHGETVDSGGNRCVRGEHGAGPDHCQGRFHVQSMLPDVLANALEPQEPGVTLIGVEHLGRWRARGGDIRTNGTYSTDTGQDFLLDAVVLVAAV